ncbi:hypothetical protein BDK92_6605 [Micromonospora pisi]|uniref:Uncharacterized protein n=1 Tax=Micromonospora pisi TaxID=589240 RepID=A0A495JTJ9_9ACTN|nr:hypothetical protein [Micromonospora pisi]RKR92171.1 hypothetical protein BDK92_6605 [Micromonospora pisi]
MTLGDEPRTRGFWHSSAPGILAAVAAIITGVGGLLAVLLQLGIIGGGDERPPGVTATGTTGRPATSASVTGAVAEEPWSQAEAVWTTTEGTTIRMPARTMGFCINGGGGVYFDQRQNIAFEQMVSIDILRSDVALSFGGRADVRIVLTSGENLQGTIDAGCEFIGNPDTGRVNLYPDHMRKIEFVR